jgi:hypothetical protein
MEYLVNVGLIKLIPKGVKIDLMGKWHPINLWNVSYKILVKSLTKGI